MSQATFQVGDEKITIRVKPRTHMGNMVGYWVWVNETKFFKGVLSKAEAVDLAYVSWVKMYR